jgi:hypothetical protein
MSTTSFRRDKQAARKALYIGHRVFLKGVYSNYYGSSKSNC